MKLCWHSNAPWTGTGYGNQTRLFVPRIAKHYDLKVSAFYGLEGSALPWKGIPVLPGIANLYGNETINDHVSMLFDDPREGLVLTLMDVWVLDTSIWGEFNVCSWVPVDHTPAPKPVTRFFYDTGAIPIAMSKFGQEQLREAGLDPLYVPHGVDTDLYKPVPRDEAREATGLSKESYVVGVVAANKGNPSRKCFVEAFRAFKVFRDRHPEAILYIHSEASGRFGGVNLLELLAALEVPAGSVTFCDQYRAVHYPYDDRQMANFYSSMDVLLSASAGEGFGVPVIEAQSCGVPVIVSDFSAQPELCGAGWKVSGDKTWTPIGAWQFRPDVEDILDKLECAYKSEDLSKPARCFAEAYDADRITEEHFLPALKQVEQRYDDLKPETLKAAA